MQHNNGVFILIVGVNASGKSTVIKPKYVKGRIKHYVNPDKLNDPDFPIVDGDILTPEARKRYALGNMNRFAAQCVDDWLENETFRNEGIGTESNLVAKRDGILFRKAKEYGMQTELYFVGIPLETAIQREQIRADSEEQDRIGVDKVTSRYRGLFNIQNHIDKGNIDVIKIYDNSRGKGEEYLILHIENGMTIFLHPEPPDWFMDANIKIPPMANLDKSVKEELKETLQNAREKMGKDSFVVSARPGDICEGEITAIDSFFAVTRKSEQMGIIHKLEDVPGLKDYKVGDIVSIEYDHAGNAKIIENNTSEIAY